MIIREMVARRATRLDFNRISMWNDVTLMVKFVDMGIVCYFQDVEAAVVSGSGTETGQIVVTSVGGRNGKPKQVIVLPGCCLSC